MDSSNNLVWEKLVESKEATLKEREERITELKLRLHEITNKHIRLEAEAKSKNEQLTNEKNASNELKTRIETIRIQLEEKNSENNIIKNDIRDQLKTIGKIERTFFASTGNKGKGELGERQVKTILEKAGIENDMWVENLQVGNSTVEFAIQSGIEGKFIPVDSKVLDAKYDNDGNIIIDNDYKTKVKTQVKEVAKYLGKKHTTEYGILVLQSDQIYMSLFEEFPSFFEEMIREFKININSPSSFLQNAWSISHLIEIYKKVHNDEKIYEEMVSALDSVSKFAVKLNAVHEAFNVAMDTHYPTIRNKQKNLTKRLIKSNKIKEIPVLKTHKEGE